MERMASVERPARGAAVGFVLVAIGVVAIALRQAGIDLGDVIERAGWPFFVILPGAFLIALAIVAVPPAGLGFAIGGSVLTTVGLLLLYQSSTGHWASWAYGWALIPTAVGLATATYGLATRAPGLVSNGVRVAVIGAALFAVGFWFFETVYSTGRAPVDLGMWWPLIVIGMGVLTVILGLRRRAEPPVRLRVDDVPPLEGDRP